MLFKLSNLNSNLALTLGYLNPALNNSALIKKVPKSLFYGPPPVCQDLSTRHDWSVKNALVDLPISLKENSKRIFC